MAVIALLRIIGILKTTLVVQLNENLIEDLSLSGSTGI